MIRKNSSKGTSSENIKVVVRVRPLNPDERLRGHQNVVQIEESQPHTITIWDPTGIDAITRPELKDIDPSCWARNFSYDHCIYSASQYETDLSQEMVFDTVGQPVVNWAIDGFNSCVLAYGQTGAGKSFTMMGNDNPAEFGLIPRICFGLFQHFESFEDDPDIDCSMEFSFVEIYNETLRDCLSPQNNGTLKVREDPRDGTFITHLTVVAVTTFEDILSLITVGNRNRSVASTKSNLHSSRSHSIVTLTVRQRTRGVPVDGLRTSAIKQKLSKIHLVDLAGSERVTNSGAVGMRLREANHINKSLSVLGDVIKCLGEAAKLKNPGHIPYRNSVLTMVLRHSLGGNSRTTMVAAVSPSSMDYEESVSTLKYAENAKKVRMRVAANVSSGLLASDGGATQLVPILQAEVKKLRDLLQAQHSSQQRVGDEVAGGGDEAMEIVREMRARVEELEEQLQDREKLIKSLELARIEESHTSLNSSISSIPSIDEITSGRVGGTRSQPYVVLADDAIDTALPRLINLNQDPLFSECLVYYIPQGTAVAGNSEMDVDIMLSGPDILSQHCLLHNESDLVWISPVSVDSKVYVNGELLQYPSARSTLGEQTTERFYLRHFDRISMGRYHLFRFEEKGKKRSMSPLKGAMSPGVSLSFSREAPGWDFAHDELMLNKDSVTMAPRSRSAVSSNCGDRGESRSPPRRDYYGFDSSSALRRKKDNTLDDNRTHGNKSTSSTSSTSSSYSRTHGSSVVASALLSSNRSLQPKANSRSVADVVMANSVHIQVPSTSYGKPALASGSLSVEVSKSPPENEEWWDKVTQVAEGGVRVNTPGELRAMLRSVMESAERQFEESERRRSAMSVGRNDGYVFDNTTISATEVAEESPDAHHEGTGQTPYVVTDIPPDPSSTSQGGENRLFGEGEVNGNGVNRRKSRSAIKSVMKSTTELPPPPPPAVLQEEPGLPPRSARRTGADATVSSGLKVSGGSAADILFAERKVSGAATRYSNSVANQQISAGRRVIHRSVQSSTGAISVTQISANSPSYDQELTVGEVDQVGNTVLSSRTAPLITAESESKGTVRFEEEASSLHQDMVTMQQKLRDRMQRYKP